MINENKVIYQQTTKILYKNSTKIIPINVIIGLLVVALLYVDKVPLGYLLTWFFTLVVIALARILHTRVILKKRLWENNPTKYQAQFAIAAFITGLLWGSSYILFTPYLVILQQVYLTLILGGMAAGGLVPMSPSRLSYYAFLFPIVIPIILFHLIRVNFDNIIFAIMYIFFTTSLLMAYTPSRRMLFENIRLRVKKDQLIYTISKANQQLKKANEKIREISRTDGLTQIANRYYFQERLNADWASSQRAHTPLALLLIDVDYFKEYNDSQGHIRGDKCLQTIAKAIALRAKRQTDCCARYGGDEFAVILFNTDLNDAKSIGEQIRRDVNIQALQHEHSPTAHHVTVSIGVAAVIPTPDDSYEKLMIEADKALYNAKLAGRNTVAIA